MGFIGPFVANPFQGAASDTTGTELIIRAQQVGGHVTIPVYMGPFGPSGRAREQRICLHIFLGGGGLLVYAR